MASLAWWTWVWVNSRSWWCTGRPGVLRFMGSQRIGHDWVTELNWVIKTNISLILTSPHCLCKNLLSFQFLSILFSNIFLLCAFYLHCRCYFSNEGPCLLLQLEGQGITPLHLSVPISNISSIPFLAICHHLTNLSQFLSVWSNLSLLWTSLQRHTCLTCNSCRFLLSIVSVGMSYFLY